MLREGDFVLHRRFGDARLGGGTSHWIWIVAMRAGFRGSAYINEVRVQVQDQFASNVCNVI